MSFQTDTLSVKNSLILAGENCCFILRLLQLIPLLIPVSRDWGPALMPAGIWQPAEIVQLKDQGSIYVKNSAFDLYREGQLNNLQPDQNADWIFNASIDIVGQVPRGAELRYSIFDPIDGRNVSSGLLDSVENAGDVITGVTTLEKSDYELWWPNGLGEQKLYNIMVDVVWKNRILASVDKRMGFRTIMINMAPISDEELAQGITGGSHCKLKCHIHGYCLATRYRRVSLTGIFKGTLRSMVTSSSRKEATLFHQIPFGPDGRTRT